MQKLLSLFVLLLFSALFSYSASAQNQEALDSELRESIARVEVTVTDLFSRSETKPVVMTIFRPPGEGKFPLLILNHGRAVEAKRHLQGRQRFNTQARWFVERGFVVMVPTRIGYGETYTAFDPEYVDACRQNPKLDRKDEALYRQIMATYNYAKTLDYVDASRWLIAGQSLGGYTTVAIARRAPEGLLGALNFSGGYGGDPENRKDNSCSPQAWETSLANKVSDSAVPILWIYWKNDWYWGETTPKKWFKAFQTGGGKGDFIHLNPIRGDGHAGFFQDQKNWVPVVEQFLQALPLSLTPVALTKPILAPPPSGFAGLEQIDKVPYLNDSGREGYKNFLQKSFPRAFAINEDGRWGWSNGQWDATNRALNFCNQKAQKPCRLYVVDDDVVWQ
jgi:dienelactone hydrolase